MTDRDDHTREQPRWPTGGEPPRRSDTPTDHTDPSMRQPGSSTGQYPTGAPTPPPSYVEGGFAGPIEQDAHRQSFRRPAAPPPSQPGDSGPPTTQYPPFRGQQQGWPPPSPPSAPDGGYPTGQLQPGPPPMNGPGPQYGAPQTGPFGPGGQPYAPPQQPGSYLDNIRPEQLLKPRKTPPARGWRRLVFRASFGLINPGPGPEEVREAQLEAKVRATLRGNYKVGVMGKGGVGKTTVSACVGSVFAELRQEDRVVAVDADTAFGKLGSRVDPRVSGSYWELAQDPNLDSFSDVRSRVGNNAAGLFVVAGELTPARRRVLDPAIYREATSRLDRYFPISIIDCSSTMDSPVTEEVLSDLDALIVVSSPWVDGAAAAGQTLDWLASRGLNDLLQRTVVVLNDSDGHADKRTRSVLAQQFAGHGQVVVEVPFDPSLRPGGVIDGTAVMSPATRRRFVEIAAALAEHFPQHHERRRERRDG
ncbi:MinD/ParA family protein [Mycobacterium sp. GA-2829]|uniref:MinD/ParA family ATP-binding protein n=1 Tax=Mycobacterium sp. GA-2829 TaxID=1772283 RepID=UPI00073FD523|nr:MinD/ParA family protein [Mycobacterium sp. GA-2829]KUI36256.1 hypothetical protein AU194_16215 [Mycobacterium sp. GA-2829]